MDVITIESKAYKEIVAKIDVIANYVFSQEDTKNEDEIWVDRYSSIHSLFIWLAREEIIDPLKGIAKQLTVKGYASLSEAQKRIVEKFIEGYKQKHICDRCENGNVSSLQDYLYVADNGYCPMCEYDEQQFMKD